ncbi:MAG: hypothetical protein ACRCU0_01320 [Candidatus Rhabdochlamydia sp.]
MTSVALTSLYSYNPYREAFSALIWSKEHFIQELLQSPLLLVGKRM